jgi:hypothetical protein
MKRNAPGTRTTAKAVPAVVKAAKLKALNAMDVNAKRAAAKRRPAAGKSTASTKSKKSVAFGEDTALMYGLNKMKSLGF